MKTPHTISRLHVMQQMVFEMAQGNFHTRIPLCPENDELKAVEVLVNMLAEELQASVSLAAYARRNQLYAFPAQSTLLFDHSLSILDGTPELEAAVEQAFGPVLGQNLAVFLVPDSVKKLTDAMQAASTTPQILHLDFTATEHLAVTVTCSLSRLKLMQYFVLNVEAPATTADNSTATTAQENQFSPAYYRLIQAVKEYVLSNLSEPLPHLAHLAPLFGTNEHKLKAGFKHCFHTSVYQFYHEERLKRSYTMVQQTILPLNAVAEGNGFKTYQNFCRAFKKRFGISASEVRKHEPLKILPAKL